MKVPGQFSVTINSLAVQVTGAAIEPVVRCLSFIALCWQRYERMEGALAVVKLGNVIKPDNLRITGSDPFRSKGSREVLRIAKVIQLRFAWL